MDMRHILAPRPLVPSIYIRVYQQLLGKMYGMQRQTEKNHLFWPILLALCLYSWVISVVLLLCSIYGICFVPISSVSLMPLPFAVYYIIFTLKYRICECTIRVVASQCHHTRWREKIDFAARWNRNCALAYALGMQSIHKGGKKRNNNYNLNAHNTDFMAVTMCFVRFIGYACVSLLHPLSFSLWIDWVFNGKHFPSDFPYGWMDGRWLNISTE